MYRLASFFFALSPLAAQTAVPTARERLLVADHAAAEAVAIHGVLAGLPPQLSDDAVLVWPGAAVLQGGSNIISFLAAQHSVVGARISWQPLHITLAQDSSLALVWGVAVVDREASSAFPATHRIGRFLAALRPVNGNWKIAALAFSGLLSGAETLWSDSLGAREWPLLRSVGAARHFIAADSAFAAMAGRFGAGKAFAFWAASDAVTFSGTGELSIGPAAIGAGFDGDASHWAWGAVAAGASLDGSLGWTVGQAVITGKGPDGKSWFRNQSI